MLTGTHTIGKPVAVSVLTQFKICNLDWMQHETAKLSQLAVGSCFKFSVWTWNRRKMDLNFSLLNCSSEHLVIPCTEICIPQSIVQFSLYAIFRLVQN